MAQPIRLRHFLVNPSAFPAAPALGINLENKLQAARALSHR
jgi:hypothetical protein